MDSYIYTRIRPKEQIRLLTVLPATASADDGKSAPIRCHLDVYDRDTFPEYEALSYTWGDASQTASIVCNAREILVTRNCHRALIALRARYSTQSETIAGQRDRQSDTAVAHLQRLWIDAICINQNDLPERNGQVSIMGGIYHDACRTIVFLGEVDNTSNFREDDAVALEAMQEMQEVGRLEEMVPTSWQAGQSEAMLNASGLRNVVAGRANFFRSWLYFFSLPWFARAWVVQEALLSREVIFLWGKTAINWRALEIFASVPGELVRCFRESPDPQTWDLIEIYSDPAYTRPTVFQPFALGWPIPWADEESTRERHHLSLPDIEQATLTQSLVPGQSQVAARTLFDLLERSAVLDCRDPRDKLFALLSLFERDTPTDIAVDYQKSPKQVYIDLTWYLISHGVFEALSLARGFRASSIATPSWAVDWTGHPRPRRLGINPKAGVPEQAAVPLTRNVKLVRHGAHLILQGRLLEDFVTFVEDKPSIDVPGFQSFRTHTGLEGLGAKHVRHGDVPCLLHGYDIPMLLRKVKDVVAGHCIWHLVGECWLQYNKVRSKRPGFDMDWSRTFPQLSQSEAQDVWIQ